uniref:ABC transmembrane type-1 domain-containing protein n=1 Tax=Heterorhabditis bacteriophora TaxID=37862 RepID=A0A1I7XL72_HETBA
MFTLSLLHLINVIGNIIEWKLHRYTNMCLSSHSYLLNTIESCYSFYFYFRSVLRQNLLCDYVNLNEYADEGAGWLSRMFFCWTNELIKKGGRKQLNSLDDVFFLPPSLQVAAVERKLVENSPTYFSDGQPYSIAKSLLSTFGLSFFSLALLRIACDAFTFAGPVLLHLLVNTLEDPSPQSEAFTYALIMILCSFLAAMFSTNFTYYVQKISLRVRAATVTAIYDKLLRVPISEMHSFSSGKILNFISTDVDRIVNFCNSFHAFWSLPVQLLIALYLLHREINVEVGVAFISGLLAAIFLIPINKYVTNCIGKMSEKLMHCKDQLRDNEKSARKSRQLVKQGGQR